MSTAHERAVERAQEVIAAYKSSEKDFRDYEEVFTDLLADLMHYWHELRIDREVDDLASFDGQIASAEMHFEAEINEEDE